MRRSVAGSRLLRRGGYVLSLGLAVGAALEPVVRRPAPALEYLVIFDLTLSMAAEDYTRGGFPVSRLDFARDVFRRALPRLPETARVSVAGFAGSTVQVFLLSHPVADPDAIETALSVLEWDNAWDVGSRVDRGLRDIVVQGEGSPLFSATNRRRILPAPLNVFFFTDGGGTATRPTIPGDATAWLADRARVTLIGVGSERETPVPEPKRAAARDCLRDETGECFVSRLEQETLRSLAEWVEGRYERLSDAERLAELLLDDPLPRGETEVEREAGWLLGLGSLAAFLLWSLV